MTLPKSLLIIALHIYFPLLAGFDSLSSLLTVDSCQEIEVSWSKKDTSNGLGNGTIDLVFKGERSQYAVYILTEQGKSKLLSSENSIKNLKKGRHGVVITAEKEDSDYCQKFFEVVIN